MLGMPGFDEEHDSFNDRAKFIQIFAWRPRRCWISKRWLWLTQVIQGEAIWVGPGTPVVEYRYYNATEYLLQKLKGAI